MSENGDSVVRISCEQSVYPPYHSLHGTPHSMRLRRVVIETPAGKAAFEQTDYGHPGRLNPWEPRGIAPSLTPRLAELIAIAANVAALQPEPSK